ncbi:MAG: hypothetical protein KDB05_09410 [Planctomycetales bacterium]|nr:hypothetical protein [Planctomycetales bacterium]
MMRRMLIAVCLLSSIAEVTNAQSPGHGAFGGFFGGSGRLLVDMKEVREELGVDDQQAELLDALLEDLADQRRALREQDEGPRSADETVRRREFELRLEMLAEFDRRSEALIAVVLEPSQASRLSELYLQRDGIRAFERPEVATKLELSDEQKQRLQTLRDSLVENRTRRSSYEEQRRLLREKELAGLRAVLNEEQQTRWQQLLGKPFEFPASTQRGARFR